MKKLTRIELDKATSEKLDIIKSKNWNIVGKGHSETVRFLAKFYETNKNVSKVIAEELEELRREIPQSVKDAQIAGIRELVHLVQLRKD